MTNEVEFIGGKEKRPLVLVPYQESWPMDFEIHRAKIQDALGDTALRVDHIGSTSVPGLIAKPIIDIQLSVRNTEAEEVYLPQLETHGYAMRVREQGHRMLRTTPDVSVHIHVCPSGSEWERRHLLFRDWLRSHYQDRDKYAQAKLDLSEREWDTLDDYADAKGPIIAEITARAESWALETSWHP